MFHRVAEGQNHSRVLGKVVFMEWLKDKTIVEYEV